MPSKRQRYQTLRNLSFALAIVCALLVAWMLLTPGFYQSILGWLTLLVGAIGIISFLTGLVYLSFTPNKDEEENH